MFSKLSLSKKNAPRVDPFVAPGALFEQKLVEVYYMMLHTKYQGSRHLVSDKKIFSCFPYISLCKTYYTGAVPFLASVV